MAIYKVLQDIEAEDKLVGPLTLKQFVFAGITIVIGFIQFKIITTAGPAAIKVPFIFALLVPMLIFGFLAAPIGRDQPNDVWLLARLRFYFKPHRRIWDQNGMSQLVTITAPKRMEENLTNNLSQTEVKSRLQALANTLDSRGWAIKNVNVNLYGEPGYINDNTGDDRLLAPSTLPQDVPITDIQAGEDIFDERTNPTAQHLNQMMQDSTQAHRQQVMQQAGINPAAANPGAGAPTAGSQAGVDDSGTPVDYWFMNQPSTPPAAPAGMSTFRTDKVVLPGSGDAAVPQPTDDEKAFITTHHQADEQAGWNNHMRKILPIEQQRALDAQKQAAQAKQTETAQPNPAILELASNDDLNVATIARQADRVSKGQDDSGEVVISLH